VDLLAVMTEVDTRLRTITALRTTSIGTDSAVSVPAAVQYLPDRIDFDQTAGRGSDKINDLIVVVFVGRANMRNAVKAITPYLAGSGAKSIKAKLDHSVAAPYTSCFDFQVVYAEIDYSAMIGSVNYLAALFHCNITGSGA
jgi:hypothetical protein